jgi:riboflavin biosynthesis pyrimidine reductase
MLTIHQVFPVKKQVSLEGLYLDQKLLNIAKEIGRSVVLTDYLMDQNGVVAKAGKNNRFQVPAEIKNDSDWGRFEELMAQADVIISGGSYFKRLATSQDILYQFESGNTYEALGQWRLNAGYQKRSPDVAIVTRQLDFELPEKLNRSDRKIIIFTTDSMANSEKGKDLKTENVTVVGSGEAGVDGNRMINTLANEMGYRVIMMVSGPQILDLLLKAKRMDLIYVTEAQVQIPFEDPTRVQTILRGGNKISDLQGFRLAHKFIQENAVTENGFPISQIFLRYDTKDLPV